MAQLDITRSAVNLLPDPTRRILRPYLPHDPAPGAGPNRVERVVERVLSLSPDEIAETLADVMAKFNDRHLDLDDMLLTGFAHAEPWLPAARELGEGERRLIGAYLLHEYTIEGAALTNPSIVAHPDQSGLPSGTARVVISLRAVGEGHISSIEFRTGTIDDVGNVDIDPASPPIRGDRKAPLFDKTVFDAKLGELGADAEHIRGALSPLQEHFTMEELDSVLADLQTSQPATTITQQAIHTIHWLASSNYELSFAEDSTVSQRILTPNGPAESHGLEDARFVRFAESNGVTTYYATYTAFDGFNVLPQLIETPDFRTFRVATLNGAAAVNKGIALFPRRIGGRYAALARSDGENNFLMLSDHVRFWNQADRIQVPARPWEILQIGNAGPPIETEAGWLVITHGVGPMRQYALGAILLDLEDPSRVIGHLREPLMIADELERDGYVPNVLYSCGSIIHRGNLVLPYGAADTSTRFASVSVDALLGALDAT